LDEHFRNFSSQKKPNLMKTGRKTPEWSRAFPVAILCLCAACSESEPEPSANKEPVTVEGKSVEDQFEGRIDPDNLPNYANQEVPDYITHDNGKDNPITDEGAILGRVLFYDKNLSIDNSRSCSSCHQQQFAFSDTAKVSSGAAGGVTVRHSMRLINARFGEEEKFFWDERATTLETQTVFPIKDHAELGFSGKDGRPDFEDLIAKLQKIRYYNELFALAYGDPEVTQVRIQHALAQFVRSIQSFDSKYDEGYNQQFANFTDAEKRGQSLFMNIPALEASNTAIRILGGVGCAVCHRPPAFDIRPVTGNNGVVGVANDPSARDFTVTRAPTLRNLANPSGELNGPLMHDGSITSFEELINTVGKQEANPANTNLAVEYGTIGFDLKITPQESADIIAFLKTLSGVSVYTDARWSDPFKP
jgi:cytochrome c peroxidase